MPALNCKNRIISHRLLAVVGCLLLTGAGRAQAASQVKLLVSAAASMNDVLTELGKNYQKQHPRVQLRFNFASSGTLQRQIEQGAPVDIFISAADKNMNELAAKKLIDPKTRRVLAQNRLVLIVPKNSRIALRRFKDLASPAVTHFAIGGPAVPAGMRAQEVLSKLGIWQQVRGKAVRGKDVRAALTQVELGNVDAGIVYATDAAISSQVRVISTAPVSMHKPIRYPVAVTADSKNAPAARAFVAYLSGTAAKVILRKYQFLAR